MKNNKIQEGQLPQNNMKIELGFPECVRIELVQVNELKHYEIFTWLGSLFATSAAGFWVAYATTTPSNVLFGVSVVFSVFTLIFGGMAFYYRRKLNGGKIIKTISVEHLN